jgi:hypothetical protein
MYRFASMSAPVTVTVTVTVAVSEAVGSIRCPSMPRLPTSRLRSAPATRFVTNNRLHGTRAIVEIDVTHPDDLSVG